MNLRPATMDDARFLYALRREPGYASQCFGPPPESFEAHEEWLFSWLHQHDDPVALRIVQEGNTPIGMVRVETFDRPSEVSIALLPRWRGRGLGTNLLRLLTQSGRTLSARIKPDNEASLRAFENAGFRRVAVEVQWP